MTFYDWAISRGYRFNDETGIWVSPDGETFINPNDDSGAYAAMLAQFEADTSGVYGSFGPTDLITIAGKTYYQMGASPDTVNDPVAVQNAVNVARSRGINVTYDFTYGWILPSEQYDYFYSFLPKYRDGLFDQILGFVIPAIVQFGMGFGLSSAFTALTGAGQAAAIAEDTFSIAGAGVIESSAASAVSSVLPTTTQLISKIPNIAYRLSQGVDPESLLVSTFVFNPVTGFVGGKIADFVVPYANYAKDYIAGLVSESEIVDVLDSQILAQVDELSYDIEKEITTDAYAYDEPVQTMVASSGSTFDAGAAGVSVPLQIDIAINEGAKANIYPDLNAAQDYWPEATNLRVNSEGLILASIEGNDGYIGQIAQTNLDDVLRQQLEAAEGEIVNVATQIAAQDTVSEFVDDAAKYGDVWSYSRNVVNQAQAYALAAAASRNYAIEIAKENQIEVNQDLLVRQASAIVAEKEIEQNTAVARAVAAQSAADQAARKAERSQLIRESQSAQDAAVARAVASQAAADQAARDAERSQLLRESQSAQDAAVARAVATQNEANRVEYEKRLNDQAIENASKVAQFRQQAAQNAEILRESARREMESAVSRAIEQQRIADDAAREAALSRQLNESQALQNAAVNNAVNQQRIADTAERDAALSEARLTAANDKASALQDATNRAADERAVLEARADDLRREAAIRQNEAETLANTLRRTIDSSGEQTYVYQDVIRQSVLDDVEADRAAWENVDEIEDGLPQITNTAYEQLAQAQAYARLEAIEIEKRSLFDSSVEAAVKSATSALMRTLLQNQNNANANVVARSTNNDLLQTEAKPNSMIGLLFLITLALEAAN